LNDALGAEPARMGELDRPIFEDGLATKLRRSLPAFDRLLTTPRYRYGLGGTGGTRRRAPLLPRPGCAVSIAFPEPLFDGLSEAIRRL
jgi:hypothetical protein